MFGGGPLCPGGSGPLGPIIGGPLGPPGGSMPGGGMPGGGPPLFLCLPDFPDFFLWLPMLI